MLTQPLDSKLANMHRYQPFHFNVLPFYHSCFINNVEVFFGAFLGPIMLVLSFNMVIFVVVIVVLVRHLRKRSKNRGKKAGTLRLMLNITGIASLFGLTWLFGALTFLNRQKAFQILFALTNSFQGFMIFIFFCVLNSDVRLAWKRQLLAKQKSTSSISTKLIRPASGRTGQYRHEESDTVVTEDVTTLGVPAKLVRTLSRKGKHMNEMVEVKFDDDEGGSRSADSDIPDPVLTEEMNTLRGSVLLLKRNISQGRRHMEEIVELRVNKGAAASDGGHLSEVTSQSDSRV